LCWLAALLTLFSLGLGFALIGGAAASQATPLCKSAQKSTKAHPCIPLCKTGQKSTKARPCAPPCKAGQTSTTAHPCIKAKTAATATTTKPASAAGGGAGSGSSPTTTSAGGGGGVGVGGGLQANGCAVGQVIPQGAYAGDGDEDNTNGGEPDDADGCL
jgi:hypothetical protein